MLVFLEWRCTTRSLRSVRVCTRMSFTIPFSLSVPPWHFRVFKFFPGERRRDFDWRVYHAALYTPRTRRDFIKFSRGKGGKLVRVIVSDFAMCYVGGVVLIIKYHRILCFGEFADADLCATRVSLNKESSYCRWKVSKRRTASHYPLSNHNETFFNVPPDCQKQISTCYATSLT